MRGKGMSVKALLISALFLFLINAIFSAYAVKVLKEYSENVKTYKKIREENLKLRVEIEKMLNMEKLEEYAKRKGFKEFSWEEFVIHVIFEEDKK